MQTRLDFLTSMAHEEVTCRSDAAPRPRCLDACAVVVTVAALLLSACGSSGSSLGSSPAATPGSSGASGHGTVNVLYAGSLEEVMNSTIGPAFEKATGYTFSGFPAGSKDLASDIKGKVRQGDVFLSASPAVNENLRGPANGSWVSWYAPFARTSLVLGYNPHSSFASRIKQGPWYEIIATPGLRLGFTDPKLDPKGVLVVAALNQAAAEHHEPALKQIAANQSDLFPEEELVGRIQAGQLDAGFFYTVEASAAKIPTVSLAPVKESAEYTITVLNHAPNRAGGAAFVRFLLGAQGQALLKSAGLETTSRPAALGNGVPRSLDRILEGAR
jgi:molybdate/tungstate transport system substrate-binding protein